MLVRFWNSLFGKAFVPCVVLSLWILSTSLPSAAQICSSQLSAQTLFEDGIRNGWTIEALSEEEVGSFAAAYNAEYPISSDRIDTVLIGQHPRRALARAQLFYKNCFVGTYDGPMETIRTMIRGLARGS